eukprot:tig00000655_g2845.t1
MTSYISRAAIGLVSLVYDVPYALQGCRLRKDELTPKAKALKWLLFRAKAPNWTIADLRKRYDLTALMAPTPPNDWFQPVEASHRGARISGLWVQRTDGEDDGKVVLFLHGGGLMAGSTAHYRYFLYELAKRIRGRVFALEYTLAPELRWPGQLEEALNAFSWLTEMHRVPPARIVLMGDSAGAGLAAHLMVQLRDEGRGQPLGAVMISPVVDFRMCSPSSNDVKDIDDCVVHIRSTRELVLQCLPPRGEELVPETMPAASRPLDGLAPLMVVVGSDDVYVDDALQLAQRAREAGVFCDTRVWREMWHIFPIFVPLCPEAERALDEMAGFVSALGQGLYQGGAAFSPISKSSMRAHW